MILINYNGKNFKINYDEAILKERVKHEVDWHDFEDDEDAAIEKENELLQKVFKDIEEMTNEENLVRLVSGVGKKKDGYFRKGAIGHYKVYDETSYQSEEEYGDRTLCIKCKAVSADEVDITVLYDIFKC